MAQFVYHADLYPVGTTLTDLGGVDGGGDFIVTEFGSTGRKYWRMESVSTANRHSTLFGGATFTDIEFLLLSNNAGTEFGNSTGDHCANIYIDWFTFGWLYFNSSLQPSPVTAFNVITQTKNLALSGYSQSLTFAARIALTNSTNVTAKLWQSAIDAIEANEPASTTYEGTLNTPTAIAAKIGSFGGSPGGYTTISIGTDGDAAPYPQTGQTVTTPSNLSVANVTDVSADVDWT